MRSRDVRYPNPALACLVLCCALGGAASVRAELEIIYPASGMEITWAPAEIELAWDPSLDAADLEVWLNGVPIGALFETISQSASGSTAVARGVWIDSGLALGANDLRARLGNAESSLRFVAVGDAHTDAIESYRLGMAGGFGMEGLPEIVTGPPRGGGLTAGSLDVFSLGDGGEIVLSFVDNVVFDEAGPDLAVFENPFVIANPSTLAVDGVFAEPGAVAVSQDGDTWHEFPCSLDKAVGYRGCAGLVPVLANADDPFTPHATSAVPLAPAAWVGAPLASLEPEGAGGDVFDLAELNLLWIRHVRIRDANLGLAAGPTTAGFDLDAATALHSLPATDADGDGIPDAVTVAIPEPAMGWLSALCALVGLARFRRARPVSAARAQGRLGSF